MKYKLALRELPKIAVELFNNKLETEATEVARITLDLTKRDNRLLKLSPIGVTVGDRIKLRHTLKRRRTLDKGIQGNVVGFDPESKQYLVLLFPGWAPNGMLTLVRDEDIVLIAKAASEEDFLLVK